MSLFMNTTAALHDWASSSSDEAGGSCTTPRPSLKRRRTRRKSVAVLKSPNPTYIPIPPSLLQSPYLSPDSIFQRDLPSSSPSEEDEQWLRDTVPIKQGVHSSEPSSGPSAANTSLVVVLHSHLAPLSPPIVRSRSAASVSSRVSEQSACSSTASAPAKPGRRSLSRDYFREY